MGLRTDVIAGSDSKTIESTAVSLFGVHQDLVKVLGNAFTEEFLEKDEEIGRVDNNYINNCSTKFGVDAADVFATVKKLLNSKKR